MTQNFKEPNWQQLHTLSEQDFKPALWDWLSDKGSLTQKVKSSSSHSFHVDLLGQEWLQPLPTESALLGLPTDEKALVRQIYLVNDHQPWTYGRSIFSEALLTEKERVLMNLGTKSLGELLFTDPSLQRGDFEVAEITRDHGLFRDASCNLIDVPDALWARRSILQVSGKSLLVTEVLLPAFELA